MATIELENRLLLENIKREHSEVNRLRRANKILLMALESVEISIYRKEYATAKSTIRKAIDAAMSCNI